MLTVAGFAFAAVILSFIVPFAASFIPLFSDQYDFSYIAGYKVLYGTLYRIFKIAIFTITQALLSAGLATGIGLAAAFFCANRTFRTRRWLLALSSIPLCVPAVIMALAFLLFFGNNGIVNTVLKTLFAAEQPIVTFLFSLKGVLLIHAFYNFPIAMRTISHSWELLGRDEEEAAVLLGASRFRIFRTITLPALLQPIAVSFLLIFLFCFFSFIIILLFGGLGVTTLEVELYKAARADLNMTLAAQIALAELLVAVCVTIIYVNIQQRHTATGVKQKRMRTPLCSTAEKLFFYFVMAVIIFFLIAPLVSIVLHSTYNVNYTSPFNIFFSFKAWKNVLQSAIFWRACLTTVMVSCGTSAITLTVSCFFAYLSLFNLPKWLIESIPYIPLAVSSVMLGFGWFLLYPKGSILMLILAQSALAWPFAWSQLKICITCIPDHVIQAAVLLSDDKAAVFFRIILPLCKQGMLSATAFAFAISAGDASLPIVLNVPRFQSISLLLFDYAGSYRFTEASVIAVILTILTGAVFFLQDRKA